jgi:NADPH-dependent 2,4-dienoyl-CoA reductase/sulfur reductase-like enzyme
MVIDLTCFTDPNVFSLGDASSLPTSKTAAAISAQAPVLVRNLTDTMLGKTSLVAKYDGYTSCPVSLPATLFLLDSHMPF